MVGAVFADVKIQRGEGRRTAKSAEEEQRASREAEVLAAGESGEDILALTED
jgi:hypothetical protein